MRSLFAVALVVAALGTFASRPGFADAIDEKWTPERIRRIAAMDDDRSSIPAALRVFPAATRYTIHVRFRTPTTDPIKAPEVVAREKLVGGRYLVTSIRFPDAPDEMHMIVYHDDALGIYHKVILAPDGHVSTMIGTRIGDSRTLSWASNFTRPDGAVMSVVSQESHSDDDSRWREVITVDGQITQIIEGQAKVTERPADPPARAGNSN